MHTEEEFQAKLDERPDDWQTRLVFADWLEERGDPRADGYRMLGHYRARPSRYIDDMLTGYDDVAQEGERDEWAYWIIGRHGLVNSLYDGDYIDADLFEAAHKRSEQKLNCAVEKPTRRELDDEVALALAEMPRSLWPADYLNRGAALVA